MINPNDETISDIVGDTMQAECYVTTFATNFIIQIRIRTPLHVMIKKVAILFCIMETSSSRCSVCNLRHISKPSAVWCTECDEGLCDSCQEHHKYLKLPSDVVNISQFCDKHNEKLSIYCKMHECLCCRNCIVESHNKCHEILKIEDVINNVKSSNALFEIEQTLKDVVENIEKIRDDRQNNLKTLLETRKQIVKEILKTRTAINTHIDKVQADLLKELNQSEEKESKIIRQMLNSLEEKHKEISILQGSISDIKNSWVGNGTVIVLNANASLDFEVGLPSPSFDVTYIREDNTLAVSSGSSDSQCIYIIDMENKKLRKIFL
ncbi:unnamed protein product [Mytilus edulis]|uniref:B box-type domain-containing protein n=1 Tax=Mytilus edulis TaxID=6550 RepID=A0A8S3RPC6_MYTED|nr:unnamed protein product [Mytilus edulis]